MPGHRVAEDARRSIWDAGDDDNPAREADSMIDCVGGDEGEHRVHILTAH